MAKINPAWLGRLGVAVILSLLLGHVNSEVVHPPEAGNRLIAKVSVEVTKDPYTEIYTYEYTIKNNADSKQELETFALGVAPGIEIIESVAPKGWGFFIEPDKNLISWSAMDSDPATAGVEYTNLADLDVPSFYTIKPAETLSGFIVKTMSRPGQSTFYARGFTHIPAATSESDFEKLVPVFPGNITEDSYSGVVTGPVTASTENK